MKQVERTGPMTATEVLEGQKEMLAGFDAAAQAAVKRTGLSQEAIDESLDMLCRRHGVPTRAELREMQRPWPQKPDQTLQDTDQITVCDACLQASCWMGHFYCDEYKDAGTTVKTVAELRQLDREHQSYWGEAKI